MCNDVRVFSPVSLLWRRVFEGVTKTSISFTSLTQWAVSSTTQSDSVTVQMQTVRDSQLCHCGIVLLNRDFPSHLVMFTCTFTCLQYCWCTQVQIWGTYLHKYLLFMLLFFTLCFTELHLSAVVVIVIVVLSSTFMWKVCKVVSW